MTHVNLRVAAVIAALSFAAPLLAAAPAIEVVSNGLRATGITPGADAVWFGMTIDTFNRTRRLTARTGMDRGAGNGPDRGRQLAAGECSRWSAIRRRARGRPELSFVGSRGIRRLSIVVPRHGAGGSGGPRAYLYRVHTVAPDGTRSPAEASPVDYAVTATSMYPSGSIVAQSTLQAQHVAELRRGIDALRRLAGLAEVFTSQGPPSGPVFASHFTALLAPLDEARARFGYGPFVYSNGIERPGPGALIKAGHVTQLQEVLE